jgi:hypothetical protein
MEASSEARSQKWEEEKWRQHMSDTEVKYRSSESEVRSSEVQDADNCEGFVIQKLWTVITECDSTSDVK